MPELSIFGSAAEAPITLSYFRSFLLSVWGVRVATDQVAQYIDRQYTIMQMHLESVEPMSQKLQILIALMRGELKGRHGIIFVTRVSLAKNPNPRP